ncbi:MAG: PHP domain-containing protein [Chloroflexi bacterium]|nr:PHP domain-containing protein [Chloroflexota bacterium]
MNEVSPSPAHLEARATSSGSPRPGGRLRADLHSHTRWSADCLTSAEVVIESCLRRGITCLAVTDHNQIGGAWEVAAQAPFKVIVGEEVKTREGEIIGLFLKELIPPRLTPEETTARIREQGGLVVIPHPFDRLRRSRLQAKAIERLVDQIDVIEVYNARIHLGADRRRAAAFAQAHHLAESAGSDAHTPFEFAGAYVEMPDFDSPAEFLAALRVGTIHGRPVTPLVHFITKYMKYRKKYLKYLQRLTRPRAPVG